MATMNIQRDATVLTSDGPIGRVTRVIVDHRTREVTDLVVEDHGSEYLVPMLALADVAGDHVTLNGAIGAYRRERFEADHFRPVAEEQARAESSGRSEHGGVPHRAGRDLLPDARQGR